MNNKTCIVTGANSGIGYETALALANKGARVAMVCRSQAKGEDALQRLRTASGNDAIRLYIADLGKQADIRRVASELQADFPVVDRLVNNAGTWISKRTFTEDNIETVFAVNHISYFLLSHELMPALLKADEGRIVCVGSDSHFQVKGMNWDDYTLGKKYHGLKSYAQSKLANCYFVYELHRRMRAQGIDHVHSYCVQPGLVKTDIGLKHTFSLHSLAWKIRRMGGVTPAEGAATSIYLASSPEAEGKSGLYWDKSKPKDSSKASYDEEAGKRVWDMSLEMCGLSEFSIKTT
jgi:NAD(P)-dependent dehydrogenase (short-subunit alcohol dehydrogenase family)